MTFPLKRTILFLFLIVGIFSATQSSLAISPDIVISQVYGGGGNTGATYTNDFIELFNRGTLPVNITGWSVQYASSAGSTWQVTSLSGIVQPGQYYLVQEASGSGGTTSLPTPDATGSIAMSGTNGKVVVANTLTALTGATPSDASIVDVVGYGSANFFEGSGAAPGLSNTTADSRIDNGCSDTDDNAADFTDGAPGPRNTASPLNPCVVSGDPEIIITEIMYDPNSAEDNWEWIEIYNVGNASADLTGYVVDDFNSVAHSSANIAGGTLAAGEQAILYNADDVSAGDFAAAWGSVNLIPVTDWTAMALNNGGDQVSLWDSFASYSGDNVSHANAVDTVNYAGAGFPDPVGNSIYLTDLSADNNIESNWAESTDGGATPLFTGYLSEAAGGNVGGEIGSPGLSSVSIDVIINEIMQNPATVADGSGEWFELYNAGGISVDVNGWTIADNDSDSHLINNGGPLLIPTGGYLVLGNNANSGTNGGLTVDYQYSAYFLANGADEIVLLDGSSNEIDRVEYDGGPNFPNPNGASMSLSDPILDNNDGSNWCTSSTSFGAGDLGTPGAANDCGSTVTLTLIHDVQGNGSASPLVGVTVVIEGIVVGDFQDGASGVNGDWNGFHIQEEDADADADPLTSEGIFVFDGSLPATNVEIGDLVQVVGQVSEFNGLTEITSFSGVTIVSSGNPLPTVTSLSLPVNDVADFEAFEGMYVTFPQELVISEYFNFDRFGEIVLTTDRRLTPTAEFEPGLDAIQAAQEFLLDKITLDDGRSSQNPDPAIHPNGSVFDLTNLFRGGDTVANVTGVMDFAFGLYRLQPTQGADYTDANPRPTAPDPVGGNLTVASFNVLNYFTTLDDGVNDICGPAQNLECRGADDANEFTRQRDKIIAALKAIDADIVGLIEIENNVNDDAVIDLVDGLNVAYGSSTYDYVATGPIGTDAIKVAFIYKPASVSLVGGYAILDSSVDPRFIDTANRPALAQTFMDSATGGVFTVTVNHLKSKGSDCNDIGDPDTGDGSGNCNLTRKAAAEALVDWLAADPTGSGDADFLIIGDLNSYDKEEPIDVIVNGGYTDLIYSYFGEDAYSYVFDGQTGYLDHALANANLVDEVTGVTIWHINADEADLIDYDTGFKGPNQDAIYVPDSYRSSDHDPVIVGLDLNPSPICGAAAPSINTLWPVNHNFVAIDILGVTDPDGDPISILIDSIFQDEAVDARGSGKTSPDGQGVGSSTAEVRAERVGNGNGRVYHISFTADDGQGNSCSGTVQVSVPKSQGKNGAAIDDGPLYDSTVTP